MGALILIVVVMILFKALPHILDGASRNLQQKTAEIEHRTEMIRIQNEAVERAHQWMSNRVDEVARDGHIPQWLVDDMEKALVNCGLSEFRARQNVIEGIDKRGLKVDNFGAVCKIPEELEGAAKTAAMQRMRVWLSDNNIPHEECIRAWLYNNPGKTKEDAEVSFFALEMLAKNNT